MAVSDWKMKYLDMRAKLLEATDVAYRLGFEQGMKQASEQQALQAQAQAQMQAQAAAQGMSPEGVLVGREEMPGEEMPGEGMPPEAGSMPGMGEEEMMPGAVAGAPAEGDGSELDQHINELESLVAKGQKPSVLALRKAVTSISDLRKTQKEKWSKKVEKETSSQKKFVDNLLNKWEKEVKDVTEDLEEVIQEHGIKID